MSQPWSAPIIGTPVTNVLAGGTFVQIPSGDAETLLAGGVVSDVSTTWRTLYPDADMFAGGAVIGGNDSVLAVNETLDALPNIPQAPDIAREMAELNDYLRQQTAEYWRKAEAQEAETQRRMLDLQAQTEREAAERQQRTQQIIDDLERERDRQQAEIEAWQAAEHVRQQSEYFAREDAKMLAKLMESVKAAKAGALRATAATLKGAGVGSGAGSGEGSGAGGAGSDKPKPKPDEPEEDHAAHRAAGRRIQEEAARRAKTIGGDAAREWAAQESERYRTENPEGEFEKSDFWKSYLTPAADPTDSATGASAGTTKAGDSLWLLLAAALLFADKKDK